MSLNHVPMSGRRNQPRGPNPLIPEKTRSSQNHVISLHIPLSSTGQIHARKVFPKKVSGTRANTILGQVSSNGRRTRRRVPPGGATGWMSPLSCRGLSGTQAAVTRRPQRKRGISTRRGVLGQGHRMAALHPGAADFDPGSVQSRWIASSASCRDPTSVLNGLGPQR